VNPQDRPACGPQEQIVLAFDAVDVGEKGGHQGGSREQRQRDEALLHQGCDQFSVQMVNGSVAPPESGTNLFAFETAHPKLPTITLPVLRRKASPVTQNKVLAIMNDAKFRKQAYRGTGCQRGSSPGVTLSEHFHKTLDWWTPDVGVGRHEAPPLH
jgi:hypothetical protein